MATKNEFIIGLGGVGGRALQAFRRTCVIRKADNQQFEKNGGRFEFLYVDSNDDIIIGGGWEIYAEDISLHATDIIRLKDAGTIPPISQISEQENIAPWIGKLSEHFSRRARGNSQNTDTQLQGLEGAGQLRRFGRVLFARHSARIRNVISAKLGNLQNGGDSAINFRIFCTLGGGTGSGSLIDMITLLRAMGQERGFKAKVYVYPFIAGAAADASNAGSFYENEYAALRDLNALMTGRYHPFVVGRDIGVNQGNDFVNDHQPVQQVFLSSEVAPGSPNLEQQLDYMAKACFDAIIYASGKFDNPNCLKAFSGEDLVDVTPGEPKDGTPLRSYRFSAFGARRWCVPTDQIKELLKYDTMKRIMTGWLEGAPLTKGMEHRDWSSAQQNAFNFRNGAVFSALDKKKAELMAPLQNALQTIKKNNRRDPDVLTNIRTLSDDIVASARSLMGDALSLAKMVPCYDADVEAIFKNIRDNVNRAITWKVAVGDTWGLVDVQKYLASYIQKINQWPEELLGGPLPDVERDEALVRNMKAREEEWQKLGFLTILLTHLDDNMIQWQNEDATTRITEAFMRFRKYVIDELCARVATRILALKNRVDSAVSELKDKRKIIDDKIGKYEADLVRATSGSFGDMYEYDAENLEKLREAMGTLSQSLQEAMATTYSPEWEKQVGSLDAYTSDKLDNLYHKIESRLSYVTSEEMHDRVCQDGGVQKVLVSSIIDRLAQIAGPEKSLWRDRLRDRIQKFLGNIGSSITLSDSGTGLRDPQVSPAAALVFGFPPSNSNAQLRQWLQDELLKNIPTQYAVMQGRTDTYEHNSAHEIRVLYVPYWFPARFASVVKAVYDRYVSTCQSQDGAVRTYFANIDDKDNGLDSKSRPSLTLAGDPDRKNEMKIDIAKEFFVRVGEETISILAQDADGIKLLKAIDDMGIPTYSDSYPLSMRIMPSPRFKSELSQSIDMAVRSMTPEDKQLLVTAYVDRLKKMKGEGVNPASNEYSNVNNLYHQAKDLLGV